MANHYLIQAIYGPKPTTPRIDSDRADDKPPDTRPTSSEVRFKVNQNDREVQALRSPFPNANIFGSVSDSDSTSSRPHLVMPQMMVQTSRPEHETHVPHAPATSTSQVRSAGDIAFATSCSLSSAEGTFGSTAKPDSEAHEHIHPDRLEKHAGSDWEDTDDESHDPEEPWAPTGSNMLPVGSQPRDKNVPSPQFASMNDSCQSQPEAYRRYLKAPPASLLPPPGLYYDQPTLRQSLGLKFRKNKCWSCWNPKSLCVQHGSCFRTCRVCDTDDHLGKTCPMLYCSWGWFMERGIDPDVLKAEDRQYRPNAADFPILVKKGFILGNSDPDAVIVPNMAHLTVRKFYHNKDAPCALQQKPHIDTKPTVPDVGRAALMRPAAPASPLFKAGNKVNGSLDPRLQGNFAYLTMPRAPSPVYSESMSSGVPTLTTPTAITGDNRGSDTTEARLQELEDEVLKLKMENVQKDREIRRLKGENERLHGMYEEPGQKRQRF